MKAACRSGAARILALTVARKSARDRRVAPWISTYFCASLLDRMAYQGGNGSSPGALFSGMLTTTLP